MSHLRVENVRLTNVEVPRDRPGTIAPRRQDVGRRTIICICGSDGSVGVSETQGSSELFDLLKQACGCLIGKDPFQLSELRSILRTVTRDQAAQNCSIAFGHIEAALWDLGARHLGVPCYELVGGRCVERVPVAALVSTRSADIAASDHRSREPTRENANVDQVVGTARRLVEDYGFSALKVISGGDRVETDLSVMRALREAFGAEMNLCLMPNRGWLVADALRLSREIDALDLTCLEDPVARIGDMARLRRELRTPFALRLRGVNPNHLSAAIRLKSADIILGDAFHGGGLSSFMDLSAVCRTFNLDMGIGCDTDLGVRTAANLQLAAVSSVAITAIDSDLHHRDETLVQGRGLDVKDGLLSVPDGAGIGVDLDQDKVAAFRGYRTRTVINGGRLWSQVADEDHERPPHADRNSHEQGVGHRTPRGRREIPEPYSATDG